MDKPNDICVYDVSTDNDSSNVRKLNFDNIESKETVNFSDSFEYIPLSYVDTDILFDSYTSTNTKNTVFNNCTHELDMHSDLHTDSPYLDMACLGHRLVNTGIEKLYYILSNGHTDIQGYVICQSDFYGQEYWFPSVDKDYSTYQDISYGRLYCDLDFITQLTSAINIAQIAAQADAKTAFHNFKADCEIFNKYGMSYEEYMLQIIDTLSSQCDTVDSVVEESATSQVILGQQVQHKTGRSALVCRPRSPMRLDCHDNNKKWGYLAANYTDFVFKGPEASLYSLQY